MEKTLYEKSISVRESKYCYRLFSCEDQMKLTAVVQGTEAKGFTLRLDLSGFSSGRMISFLNTLCESQTHPREFLSLLEENVDFFYTVEENSWE